MVVGPSNGSVDIAVPNQACGCILRNKIASTCCSTRLFYGRVSEHVHVASWFHVVHG